MRTINRKINLIVIHCSATRVDKGYTPEQLERDHKARGFNSAGYNYYIRKSGEIVSMRPLELIPAHVTGYNKNSIGICYEGGLDPDGNPDDTRTEAQRQSIIGCCWIWSYSSRIVGSAVIVTYPRILTVTVRLNRTSG